MKKNPTQLERVSHNLLVKNSQHLSFGDFIQAIFKVLSLDTKKERGILSSIIHQKKLKSTHALNLVSKYINRYHSYRLKKQHVQPCT